MPFVSGPGPALGTPESFITRNPMGLAKGTLRQRRTRLEDHPRSLIARGPFEKEADRLSADRRPRGGDSTNPVENPSPPPIPRTRNAAAFQILPDPLTSRAQTPAGPRGLGRCQRVRAVPQAAPFRGHREWASVSRAEAGAGAGTDRLL